MLAKTRYTAAIAAMVSPTSGCMSDTSGRAATAASAATDRGDQYRPQLSAGQIRGGYGVPDGTAQHRVRKKVLADFRRTHLQAAAGSKRGNVRWSESCR
jgi:hypothetical protein